MPAIVDHPIPIITTSPWAIHCQPFLDKGVALDNLGRHEVAIECNDKALSRYLIRIPQFGIDGESIVIAFKDNLMTVQKHRESNPLVQRSHCYQSMNTPNQKRASQTGRILFCEIVVRQRHIDSVPC
jgi:hypothetical protein